MASWLWNGMKVVEESLVSWERSSETSWAGATGLTPGGRDRKLTAWEVWLTRLRWRWRGLPSSGKYTLKGAKSTAETDSECLLWASPWALVSNWAAYTKSSVSGRSLLCLIAGFLCSFLRGLNVKHLMLAKNQDSMWFRCLKPTGSAACQIMFNDNVIMSIVFIYLHCCLSKVHKSLQV